MDAVLKKHWKHLQEVFIDRASSSTVYPGIDIQGVEAMTRDWNLGTIISQTKIGSAFEEANQTEFGVDNDESSFSDNGSDDSFDENEKIEDRARYIEASK